MDKAKKIEIFFVSALTRTEKLLNRKLSQPEREMLKTGLAIGYELKELELTIKPS